MRSAYLPKELHDENFSRLCNKFSSYNYSKFIIAPVPYEKTTTYIKGTKNGPKMIIEASANIELYDNETTLNTAERGICTLPEIKGINKLNPEEMIEKISSTVERIFNDKKIPVLLGGEHTISIGAVKAAARFFRKKNLSVLHLDAHADMKDEFEDNRYNHACTLRRIRELTDQTVHVGIRSFDEDEINYVKENKIPVFGAKNNALNHNKIIKHLNKNVYITLDLDVLDPSIMPAVGTPEPGGFMWYDILELLNEICKNRNVIGFDVVELCPIKNFESPNFTAAKLVYKIMCYIDKYSKQFKTD